MTQLITEIAKILQTPLEPAMLLGVNSIGVVIMIWSLDRISQIEKEIKLWPNGKNKKFQSHENTRQRSLFRLLYLTGFLHIFSALSVCLDRPINGCDQGCTTLVATDLAVFATNCTVFAMLLTLAAFSVYIIRRVITDIITIQSVRNRENVLKVPDFSENIS